MNLEIRSFADVGQLSHERVILRAKGDIDIGSYAVFRSGVSHDGTPTSGRKVAYWFPDHDVKADDLIILYSKSGRQSAKPLSDGRTAHFFYWGQEEAIWGSSGHCIVVLEVRDWASKIAG